MIRTLLLCACFSSGAVYAQSIPPTQTLDSAFLNAQAAELLAQAKTAQYGIASKVYITRPESTVQMAVRVKSGQGEWHHDDADILIGIEGSAQIILGGEIVDGKDTAPGEVRGDGVRGGRTQTFRAGDVIRIEPQVAHQVLVQPGTTLRYLAVKVKAAKP